MKESSFVTNVIRKSSEGEDAVQLTEEEKGFLFLLLKTVIGVIDQSGIG
jgi:hypothetical protein